MRIISPTSGKILPVLEKQWKHNEFEYNYLIICKYLNIVKSDDKFTLNINSTSSCNIKMLNIVWGNNIQLLTLNNRC